jgi:hypothetical protein
MEETIRKIIEFGTYAPSGENIQPWRVMINSAYDFSLFNLPDADSSIYNSNQIGSFIALGAFLENISIGAHSLGYEVEIKTFPSQDKNHIASINLKKSSLNYDEDSQLVDFIKLRCTNRKPQEKVITPDTIKNLLSINTIRNNDSIKVVIIPSVGNEEVANLFSLNERLTFGKKEIHKFFFEHIRWTKKDLEENTTGMYIKTLELPLLIQKFLMILKKMESDANTK